MTPITQIHSTKNRQQDEPFYSVFFRADLLNKLAEFKRNNGEKYGILSIGIFGSFARNQTSNLSDADIVVKTKTPDPFTIVHIKESLEEQLRIPVDIVRFRETMNPLLKKRIEQEAVYVR